MELSDNSRARSENVPINFSSVQMSNPVCLGVCCHDAGAIAAFYRLRRTYA